MHPANERWHYNVKSSLIGWVHIQKNGLHPLLIYWGWDKKATIFQKTVSNAFSLIKLLYFDKKLIEICSSIGLDNGLVLVRQQTIIWTNDDYFIDAYMHTFGINELTINLLLDHHIYPGLINRIEVSCSYHFAQWEPSVFVCYKLQCVCINTDCVTAVNLNSLFLERLEWSFRQVFFSS